jgi:hypothetical protein
MMEENVKSRRTIKKESWKTTKEMEEAIWSYSSSGW